MKLPKHFFIFIKENHICDSAIVYKDLEWNTGLMVFKFYNVNDIILCVRCFQLTIRFLRFILVDVWSCCSFFHWWIVFHCVRIQQFIWQFFLSMGILVVYRLFVLLLIAMYHKHFFLCFSFTHGTVSLGSVATFKPFRPQYSTVYILTQIVYMGTHTNKTEASFYK